MHRRSLNILHYLGFSFKFHVVLKFTTNGFDSCFQYNKHEVVYLFAQMHNDRKLLTCNTEIVVPFVHNIKILLTEIKTLEDG